jgi:hypothetical protein
MDDPDFNQLLDRVMAIEFALSELVVELERSGRLDEGSLDLRLARVSSEILEGSAPHQGDPRRDLSGISEDLESLIDDLVRARRR